MAPLRRAGATDVAAVNALQHAAYARNRTILGLEPLPLTVDYATIVADYEVWLLTVAQARARELGRRIVRLYTGEKLTGNIAWYERHGFAREKIEVLGDRRLVHMMKTLD